MNPRVVAAAQIVLVTTGVYAAVFALSKWGIDGSFGMLFHVGALAISSVGLCLVALAWEPSRIDALGLGLGPVRGRVPLVVMFGLAGGVATYAVNAVVSLGWIFASGGIEKNIGMAKDQEQTLSQFAAIPLYVMIPVVMIAGVYEDIVFRGFFLGRLRILMATGKSWVGDALSVVISSVIFGLGHLYQGWFGVMKTTVAGMCLAILVLLTKSVWPAMIAHAGIDAATIVMLHFLTPFVEKALKEVH